MDGWLLALLFSMFPYVSQTGPDARRFENDCGAASVSMIILAQGGDYYSPDELMGNREASQGLSFTELRDILASHGVAATAQQHPTLQAGDIVMLDATYYNGSYADPGWWSPHYVVFLFRDGGDVVVNDPLYGARLHIPQDRFDGAWNNIASKALVVDW